jgi:hypothetical protein
VSGDVVLVESLRFAVPLWIEELRDCTPDQRMARASRCATVVGEKGDALQFKGQSAAARRSTAEAFNRLAEGLAIAAYMPGGVVFAGHHWCVGSKHMGVEQKHSGPCLAEVKREEVEGPAITPTRLVRRPIIDVHLPEERAS